MLKNSEKKLTKNKTVCFIHTETNGLHGTDDYVSTKNLYNFARLIRICYSIGTIEDITNGLYNETKCVSTMVKPNTINITNIETLKSANDNGIDGNIIIQQLKDDLKSVDIIISNDLSFHLKAIQVECFRSAITLDFSKFILIDTLSFGQNNVVNTFNKNTSKPIDVLELDNIKNLFIKLYEYSYSK